MRNRAVKDSMMLFFNPVLEPVLFHFLTDYFLFQIALDSRCFDYTSNGRHKRDYKNGYSRDRSSTFANHPAVMANNNINKDSGVHQIYNLLGLTSGQSDANSQDYHDYHHPEDANYNFQDEPTQHGRVHESPDTHQNTLANSDVFKDLDTATPALTPSGGGGGGATVIFKVFNLISFDLSDIKGWQQSHDLTQLFSYYFFMVKWHVACSKSFVHKTTTTGQLAQDLLERLKR